MDDRLELLDSVINSVTEHLAIIDASGVIRYVNQTWVDFGISNGCVIRPNDWLGVNYLAACEASSQAGDDFGIAASNLIRQVITAKLDSGYFEYPCHSPTETRWFMMRVRPLRWNGPPHFAISHHNITERKLAETALQNQETRLRAIVNYAVDGIITIDELGAIDSFNPAAERLFGYTAAEVTGKNMKILLPEPYQSEYDCYLANYGRTGQAKGIGIGREVVGLRKDGSTFPLNLALSELRLGTRRLFTGLLRDISDRKAAESKLAQAARDLEIRNQELEQAHRHALHATKAKSDFLASMSHEIRTSMNAIVGMADLLQSTKLTPDQDNYVGRFSRATASLMDLINAILDFSKIEAGHMTLEAVPINLPNLVDSISELVAGKALVKHVELMVFVHPDVPQVVVGDPTRLHQVLLNLVGNAIKFTDVGYVTISIEPVGEPSTNPAMCFSVSDTGIGIPADKLQTIFEPFTQVDATTTRKYGGTGLGLNIAQRLVELMGGRLEVESTAGIGSTFSFTLRLPESSSLESNETVPHPDLSGRHILVVDDNETNLMILREYLSRSGVHIIEATSGTQALTILDEVSRLRKPIDLVILDHHMPGMTGLELAQAIRDWEEFTSLPLILHVSDLLRDDADRANTLRITRYLYKPLSRTRLIDTLADTLGLTLTTPTYHKPMASVEPSDRRSYRILLVEDLEDNRDLIALFLKETPHQLEMAENGAVALRKFQTGTYDVVFMDMQMPVMDGLQATAAIRQWEREQHRIPTPIIALTANAFKEETDKSLAAGCTAYVTKPIKKNTFLTTITQYVASSADQAA